MGATPKEIELIANEMGIDTDEVSLRKAYLDITPHDIELLKELHAKQGRPAPELIASFYSHLLSFEQTRELLPDDGIIDRLRSAQIDYFEQLTGGKYDWNYVENRLKVGLVHQKVGLEPKWYLGAYSKYINDILPEILTLYSPDTERASQVLQALSKVVFFDLGLALDTYFHADNSQIIKLKQFSDQIIACMPTGLLAFDDDLQIIMANTAARNILGLGDISPIGTLLSEYLPVDMLSGHLESLEKTGLHSHGVQIKIPYKNSIGKKSLKISLSQTTLNNRPARLLMIDDITKEQVLQNAVINSKTELSSILENIVDGVVTINSDAIIETFNASAVSMFGYEENEVIGKNVNMLMPEPYHSRHDSYVKSYLKSGKGHILGIGPREVQGKHKDGSTFPIELAISEMTLNGEPRFIGVLRDITERKETEEKTQTLFSIVEQTADLVLVTTPGGVITYINPAFENITGYSKNEVIGRTPSILKSGRHGVEFYNELWDTLRRGEVFNEVFINRKKDGTLYYEEKTIMPLRNTEGVITQYVSTGKDVTERMQVQEHFHYLATHDALTELPNRMLLMERLEQAISRGHWHNMNLALLFIDADRFKVVNDTLGHDAGDSVLKEISGRLIGCVRPGDTVARLSGDEFVVMLADISNTSDASIVASKILRELSRPFYVDGHELFITASIGISCYPSDGEDAATLLKNADLAMYKVKEIGNNNFQFFSADMTEKALERLQMESSLRSAIENNEFILFYQPQVDTQTGKIVAAESLIRWQHPQRGTVSPLEFIPILEETGLIEEVGYWIFDEACRQCKEWESSGLLLERISINLSLRQFRSASLFNNLKKILTKHKIPGTKIELEITESVLMEDAEETIETLSALRTLGVKIAVDDFGTGYSSLSYLKKLPIDTLKIDRSFIFDIPHDKDDVSIVSAILSMANALGLEVVAEGVEGKEQLEFLAVKKCKYIQGFFFSKPVPQNEMVELLTNQVN